jgi:hypothetical protein
MVRRYLTVLANLNRHQKGLCWSVFSAPPKKLTNTIPLSETLPNQLFPARSGSMPARDGRVDAPTTNEMSTEPVMARGSAALSISIL